MTQSPVSVAKTNKHAEDLDSWNEIVLSSFAGSSVDAAGHVFPAQLTDFTIEDFNVVCVRSQPSHVHRWASGGPSHRSGDVLLHLLDSGTGVNHQRSQATLLAAGDGAICDADRHYSVDFKTPYRIFVVKLPLARLLARNPSFDVARCAGSMIDGAKSRLLLALLRSACDEIDYLGGDADWRHCVSRSCIDLAMAAVGSTTVAKPTPASPNLRRAVITYIRDNLDDPDLRTSTIAAALGVSGRAIQFVFEGMSTTASAFILDQRLEKAAARLRDEKISHNITEIAFSNGFNDSAYFSRCFRKKYGTSPRSYRGA